jgi:membrane-bound lytic murein transglycosylase A
MEEILAMAYRNFVFFLPVCVTLVMGCAPKPRPTAQQAIDFTQPLPDGQLALRKISPAEYPDFSKSLGRTNLANLRQSVQNSLAYLSRPSSQTKYPYLDITHDRAVASLQAMLALIDGGGFAQPAAQFNQMIADRFEVYQSIGAPRPDGSGYTNKVLFTGYFTPTYNASLTRGGEFQFPIYKRPADLVSDESGDTAYRKLPNGTTGPYPTRQEIESGLLAGQELAWVTSRWNAYVITVQGSARLRLPDGRIMEVGYAGNNGREYTSPGLRMVADGVIDRKDLSFETMRRYFDWHPDAMDRYLWLNQRTVFFTERPGGPFGALNVPVTAFATIATDKAVYPPAMPAFLSVPIPATAMQSLPAGSSAGTSMSGSSLDTFMLDQDRGGAIRSAGRCDIYMGIGQSAEQMSGHQLSAGALYYLAAKP